MCMCACAYVCVLGYIYLCVCVCVQLRVNLVCISFLRFLFCIQSLIPPPSSKAVCWEFYSPNCKIIYVWHKAAIVE